MNHKTTITRSSPSSKEINDHIPHNGCVAEVQEGFDLIVRVNPNSPTGRHVPRSEAAAVTALRHSDHYDACYVETHRLRSNFVKGLKQIGMAEIIPGMTNFVLFHLPDHGPDGATVISECQQQGLFIRDASEMSSGMGDRAIRVAIKEAATNQKIRVIINSVLQNNLKENSICRKKSSMKRGNH